MFQIRADDLLSSNIDLVNARKLASLVVEQLHGDVLVERLDLLLPVPATQGLAEDLLLLRVIRGVARQQEVVASLTEDKSRRLTEQSTEVTGVLDNTLDVGVGGQVHLGRVVRRTVVGVVRLSAEVLHDVPVLTGDGHGVVSVDGVRLVPVGESAEAELVEDTALVDVQVVAGLSVTPVGHVSSVLVNL